MDINELYFGYTPYLSNNYIIEATDNEQDIFANDPDETTEKNKESLKTTKKSKKTTRKGTLDINSKDWEKLFTEYITSGEFENMMDGIESIKDDNKEDTSNSDASNSDNDSSDASTNTELAVIPNGQLSKELMQTIQNNAENQENIAGNTKKANDSNIEIIKALAMAMQAMATKSTNVNVNIANSNSINTVAGNTNDNKTNMLVPENNIEDAEYTEYTEEDNNKNTLALPMKHMQALPQK